MGVAFKYWSDTIKKETGQEKLPEYINKLYFEDLSIQDILNLQNIEAKCVVYWKDSEGNQRTNEIDSWADMREFLRKNPGVKWKMEG